MNILADLRDTTTAFVMYPKHMKCGDLKHDSVLRIYHTAHSNFMVFT